MQHFSAVPSDYALRSLAAVGHFETCFGLNFADSWNDEFSTDFLLDFENAQDQTQFVVQAVGKCTSA